MGFVVSEGALTPTVPGMPTPPATVSVIGSRGVHLYAGLTATYEAIYRTQPNVRTVVSFLGRNMAQLTLKLYRRDSDTERERLRDHPADRLLRHPNHREPRYRFMRALVEDLEIFDNYVALKVRDPRTDRAALVRIPPRYVDVVSANPFFADVYRITMPSGGYLDVPYTNIVHIPGYNPEDARWGLSSIESLRRLLAEDTAAGQYREQMWQRGARTTGVITRPLEAPRWSDKAVERFRTGFTDAFAGNGPEAGGVPVLEDGMTYEPVTMTAQDLEYLGTRKLTREECAAAYHVNPGLVGVMDNANIANIAASHTGLYQDTFAPRAAWIEEELSLQLLPDFETSPAVLDALYYEFNLDEKLKGDFATEAEATSRAVGGPWLSRNEARARRNLPPMPGGDDLIVPLNVTTGGRANPADTAPGTPGAGQAARGPAGVKAAATTPAPAPVDPWVGQHVDVLTGTVTRMRSSVRSLVGAGSTLEVAFNLDRWAGELGADLNGLALAMTPEAAAPVADAFGAVFDVDRVSAYLAAISTNSATAFNTQTLADAQAAYADAFAALAEGGPDPTLRDAVDSAFESALNHRIPTLADSRSRLIVNFARHEAALQAGATSKTWVTGPNARPSHQAWDGMTVAFGQAFPNGGRYPRDLSLPVDERVGCNCTVSYGNLMVENPEPALESA